MIGKERKQQMGNTVFYREAQKSDSKITWSDIFSDSFRKHSKEERDYAMAVGTSLRRVSEANMLQTWQKPWLWFPAAKLGLGLIALVFAAYFGCKMFMDLVTTATLDMMLIIPPVVVPIIIMIFFWELNIPQNISLVELFIYFVVGAVLSFVITGALILVVKGEEAYWAPLREEPAKLVPSVMILLYMERVQKKKIYGLTGLVVGGAVGAGFSGFESVSYALRYGMETELLRIVLAIGGHMVFSAPFVAALGLAAHKKGRLTAECFVDPGFLAAYATANAIHFVWNFTQHLAVNVLLIFVMWVIMLYWVRRCLNEAVLAGRYVPGSGGARVSAAAGTLRLTCIAGPRRGQTWQSTGHSILLGRDAASTIQLPGEAKGVSRRHCSIQNTSGGWTVRDLNASYGTFISGGRLASGQEVPLRDGEIVYLGSKQVAFRVSIQ